MCYIMSQYQTVRKNCRKMVTEIIQQLWTITKKLTGRQRNLGKHLKF